MLFSWLRSKRPASHCLDTVATRNDTSVSQLVQQAVDLHTAGQLGPASALYRQILQQNPRQFDALHMLGVVALQRGAFRDAETLIRDALRSDPQSAAALYNLAMALNHLGRSVDAIPQLRQALSISPNAANICALLASVLSEVGDRAAARDAFVRTTQLAPDDAIAHNNLGAFLVKNAELPAAIASFSRAAEINPQFVLALRNLASSHFALGNIGESLDVYARLIVLPGADAATYFLFGNALLAAGSTNLAVQQYQRSLALQPEYAKAHWAIAMAHLRPIYDDVQDMEASRTAFARALEALNDWFTPTRLMQGGGDAVGSVQPFFLTYQPRDNRVLLAAYGRLCARLMQPQTPQLTLPGHSRGPGKIRVGFVSAFVRNHSVWHAITRGWITHLDLNRFEVHVFHLGQSIDDETAFARREATNFVGTARAPHEWMSAILDAQLDALIYPDIGMHPLATQLATQRLAPVQAASWGHPDTTGLATIDLFLSADLLEPPDGGAHYTEKLVRLPNLGVCVEPLRPNAAEPDLDALGVPADVPLLLCPGQLFKYSPEHDEVWAALGLRLQQSAAGRLVFFRNPHAEINAQFERRLRSSFDRVGANFDATVCLIPTLPRQQFYGLMQRAALMLDSIDFSGFNTALQCVECGLPLVAYEGAFMRGRLASGLLRRMGLDDWVATSHAEFVDKAIRLVQSPQLQQAVRQEIGARRATLYGDISSVRALEQVLVDAITQARETQRTAA